jgi:hypothetical protein
MMSYESVSVIDCNGRIVHSVPEMAGLSVDERHAILAGNARRFFDL